MRLLSLLIAVAAALSAEAPRELVGEWMTPESNNPVITYRVYADGRFDYTSTSTTLSPGCETRVLALATGTVTAETALLHFDHQSSRFRSVNQCRPKWDYEKAGPTGRNTFRWRIVREGPSWVLVLHALSGMEQRLFKR